VNKALLDTNILSYFLRGNISVTHRLGRYRQYYDRLTFSILSYYEIKSGLLYRDARNILSRFEELAAESDILPLSLRTTDIASEIYRGLRSKGIPTPPIDLLIAATAIEIAATAIEHDAIIITANIRDFENIPGLTCQNWAEPI
jgi:tRNA(fMet)-specific endonuclease VapC